MPGKLIYFVLLIKKKQNRTLLLSLTKKHAWLSWTGRWNICRSNTGSRCWRISAVITSHKKRADVKLKALCISLTLASKTASRLCQSLSISSKPSRSSTVKSTKLFCDQTSWLLSQWAHDRQPSVNRDKSWCNNTFLIRYHFSDPQAGRDICDRKTVPMKAYIKRWVCDNCRKYERGFRIPQLPQRL